NSNKGLLFGRRKSLYLRWKILVSLYFKLSKLIIMHIAIAGNIGAGKTTLTKLLAKHYKWEPQFEEVVENPYLEDFYNQMERWSFNLQVYFLNTRFRQILEIRESGKDIIQDRTI